MLTKDIGEVLKAVGHVAEVGRLLSILSTRRSAPLTKLEIIELASQTAGAGHRYPQPAAALDLALRLGLVRRVGPRFAATPFGDRFMTTRSPSLIDLTDIQARFLLALILDDHGIREDVRRLFGVFRPALDGRYQARMSEVSEHARLEVARLLQQVGALHYSDGHLLFNPEFDEVLGELMTTGASVSEDALWARLDAQRQRARMVEKRVLQEEKLRLTLLGREDLAEAAYRTSETNVAAGYDIHSFEASGSSRCIEVKSSVGRRIRFYWSSAERAQAARLRKGYWIYFVPTAQALPPDFCPVLMIRDPIARIKAGTFVEEPSTFEVADEAGAAMDVQVDFSTSLRMKEW